MSDNYNLIIKNGSCYIDGKLVKTDLALLGNKIKKIGKVELNSSNVIDATDKVILPGIIDTQVHFREPGSTDAEDLESGSRAAVLGGVTSLFEMPNTNPPTSNLVEFDKKLKLLQNEIIAYNQKKSFQVKELNKKKTAARLKLITETNLILVDFAKENNISIILKKESILLGHSSIDITNKILKIIDTKKLKINIE